MSAPLPPGLLVAAPASGEGKTTLTLGLLRAFSRSGLRVRPFKSGPDYIDPGFHAAAAGLPSFNLDTWAMEEARIADLVAHAAGADLVVAEGSMGLFDGVAKRGGAGRGSGAELAALTGWPVVLVLDASGMAQTAGAVALGFATLRPEVRLAGVVLNKIASPRHEALTRLGLEEAGIPVLGVLPRRPDLTMPERHLGLVQAQERPDLEAFLEADADFVSAHADLAAIRAAAAPTRLAPPDAPPVLRPPGNRVALAQDAAFSFVYPHLLEGWRRAGAEILPFAPLADQGPDPSADVCWLPGGYPELHAGALASRSRFLAQTRAFAATRPVHGECGGYMALGAGLETASGERHEMLGLLGLETSFAKRKMRLGYRLARLRAPMPGHAAGALLRGHEFHYASILAQPDAPLAEITDANGDPVPETGSRRGFVTGSFLHLIAEAT